CADAQKLRRFTFEPVVMTSREPLERRPFLAGLTNELPFVFANWTARRRFCSLSKLRPALHADKVFHWQKVIELADVTMLKEHRDERSPVKTRFVHCSCALPLPLQRAQRPEGGRALHRGKRTAVGGIGRDRRHVGNRTYPFWRF